MKKLLMLLCVVLFVSAGYFSLASAQFEYSSPSSWESSKTEQFELSSLSKVFLDLNSPISKSDLPSLSENSQRSDSTIFIDQCGVLDQSDTRYVLTQDIYSTGTCFSVYGGSNITLNGNNHSVFRGCADGLGVLVEESKEITVQNVNFDCFGWGILFINTTGVSLNDISLTNMGGPGIYLYNVSTFIINNSTSFNGYGGAFVGEHVSNGIFSSLSAIHHGGAGIYYYDYKNLAIVDSAFTDNLAGIFVGAGSNVTLQNISTSFDDAGVYLFDTQDFFVNSVYADKAYSAGILLNNVSFGSVININSTRNYNPGFPGGPPAAGIKILNSRNLHLSNLSLERNGYGISCFGRFYGSIDNRSYSQDNIIEYVDASYSDFDAINFNFACSNNTVRHVTANHNNRLGRFLVNQYGAFYSFSGISLYDFNQNNLFYNVTLLNNTQYGIFISRGSHGNRFENIVMSDVPTGIYLNSVNNTYIINSVISNTSSTAGNYSFRLVRSFNTTLIDSYYNDSVSSEFVDLNSTLYRLWTTRIQTRYGNSTSYQVISGANVTVYYGSSPIYSSLTGERGYTPKLYLFEYATNNNSRTYFNYTVSATHPKVRATRTPFSVSQPTNFVVMMREFSRPLIRNPFPAEVLN